MKTNKLTPKEWRLYKLIKFYSETHRWLSVEDICDELPDDFKLGKTNCEGSNTNCRALYKEIDTINNSAEVEKIIIVDNNRIYLGSEEQAKRYAERLKGRAVRQFIKYWNVFRKVENDGQGKLLSCQEKPIDSKSKARAFVESFIENEVEIN